MSEIVNKRPPFPELEWRWYSICSRHIIFGFMGAFTVCFLGLRLINSAVFIEYISIKNAIKVFSGMFLILVSLVIFNLTFHYMDKVWS
jgi:hypothetical protein